MAFIIMNAESSKALLQTAWLLINSHAVPKLMSGV